MQSAGDTGKYLTDSQRRVLHCLLEGLGEKEAAMKLKLSVHTVHNHVKALFKMFEVHSHAELQARVLLTPWLGRSRSAADGEARTLDWNPKP
jgi:DNA-binding CsgD family transcriptional regulator